MASRLKNWKANTGAAALPLLLGVFAAGLVAAWVLLSKEPVVESFLPEPLPPEPVTLLFVGDIMMDRGIRTVINKYFEGDYNALFANTPYIADADIAFANLEGTVTEEFGSRTGSKFSFRMAPESVTALKAAGFDIVSFANNHVGDYSTKGFLETINTLNANTLSYTGAGKTRAEATTPTVIDVRGMRVGFLAATDVGPDWLKAGEDKPGILLASDPELATVVAAAKAQVDVLVVSFHWGNEYSPVSDRQTKIARAVVDAGADIVVGHHPHVMQKFEYYNGKVIFYSLGNFIFDQYFSPFTLHGMVGEVTIDPATFALTASAQISYQNDRYIPQPPFPFEEKFLLVKSFTP